MISLAEIFSLRLRLFSSFRSWTGSRTVSVVLIVLHCNTIGSRPSITGPFGHLAVVGSRTASFVRIMLQRLSTRRARIDSNGFSDLGCGAVRKGTGFRSPNNERRIRRTRVLGIDIWRYARYPANHAVYPFIRSGLLPPLFRGVRGCANEGGKRDRQASASGG